MLGIYLNFIYRHVNGFLIKMFLTTNHASVCCHSGRGEGAKAGKKPGFF